MVDGEIRLALFASLRSLDPEAVLYQELPLSRGDGRADCVSVNGSLHGYEIKSERDSLARLSRQVNEYDRVFEFCTLVVEKRHLRAARNIIPSRWGISLAIKQDAQVKIEPTRKASRNSKFDRQSVMQLLWKHELVAALRNHNIKRSINTPIADLWSDFSKLPKRTITAEVRAALKRR
jgi:hypothetical protein